MQYPQIAFFQESNAFLNVIPYPGENAETGAMSLQYYRHHQGWTRSQEFRDSIALHNLAPHDVNQLTHFHDLQMETIATQNGYTPLFRFRRLINRLVTRAGWAAIFRDYYA